MKCVWIFFVIIVLGSGLVYQLRRANVAPVNPVVRVDAQPVSTAQSAPEPLKPVEAAVAPVPHPESVSAPQRRTIEDAFRSVLCFVSLGRDLVSFVTLRSGELLVPISELSVRVGGEKTIIVAVEDRRDLIYVHCFSVTICVSTEEQAVAWRKWLEDEKQKLVNERDPKKGGMVFPPGYAPQSKAPEEKPKEIEWETYGSVPFGRPVDVIVYDPRIDVREEKNSVVVVCIITPPWIGRDGLVYTMNFRVPLAGLEFVARTDDVKELAARFAEFPLQFSNELHDYHRVQIACPIEALPLWRLWLERMKKEHAEHIAVEQKKVEEAAPKPRMILPPKPPEEKPLFIKKTRRSGRGD